MRLHLRSVAAGLGLSLAIAAPAGAAGLSARDLGGSVDRLVGQMAKPGAGEVGLKADIDALLDKLEKTTHGFVKFDGADRMDIHREGDAEIADIENAHIAIDPHSAHPSRITLDHIQIRRAPGPDDSLTLDVVLPHEAVARATNGEETTLTLQDAKAKAIIDAKSGRARETLLTVAGARIDDKKTGDWLKFGPLSFSSKLAAGPGGGWSGPIDFALKRIEFSFNEGPASGAIDAIGYKAETAGPDLAALNQVRDKLDALRQNEDIPPQERLDELFDLLPKMYALFSLAKGELTVDGVVVHGKGGETLAAIDKASMGGVLSGLSGDLAAWRVTMQHDGLKLAATLVDPRRVPNHAVLDFGVEDLATGPLRTIVAALSKMREGAPAADKQQATAQMMAAATQLSPVLRLHELAVEAPDVGVKATAEARGSPLKGYNAEGDVSVRGFDALQGLVGDDPPAAYLAVLKEIGTPAKAADGTPRLKFHLTSALGKWLTINGSDMSAWLVGDNGGPGRPRRLHPAAPPMTGDDVRALQQALAEAHVAVPQSGRYDAATAGAVARFQKQHGLNVDGIVDAETRAKLGLKPEPTAPGPGHPPAGPGPKKGPN